MLAYLRVPLGSKGLLALAPAALVIAKKLRDELKRSARSGTDGGQTQI
jgi:hypothetical protein